MRRSTTYPSVRFFRTTSEYLQRIPIEGKFGQGKNGYRLNYIRAKRADTSSAWINSIFLVMNLLILLKVFYLLAIQHGILFLNCLKHTLAILSGWCRKNPASGLAGWAMGS